MKRTFYFILILSTSTRTFDFILILSTYTRITTRMKWNTTDMFSLKRVESNILLDSNRPPVAHSLVVRDKMMPTRMKVVLFGR